MKARNAGALGYALGMYGPRRTWRLLKRLAVVWITALLVAYGWFRSQPWWVQTVVVMGVLGGLTVGLLRRRPAPVVVPPAPRQLGYVYRYYDEAGTLLYVGSTGNIERRTDEHRRDGRPWARPGVTMNVETLPSREAAYDVEAVAIARERPVYNVAGMSR